jgi:hypothetical protein
VSGRKGICGLGERKRIEGKIDKENKNLVNFNLKILETNSHIIFRTREA